MPPPKERSGIDVQSERAIVAAVRLPESIYDHADPFGELRSLAEQGGAIVVGELTQNLLKPVAGSFMGTGKLHELKQLCDTLNAKTVIFDHGLSPKQIAKIEEVCERKVIDRSELILDIFASRASTTEAQLQVELAQLEYTYPRLRAMWTHLERIVGSGGIGGVGTRGPGEQQLEIDRRLVQSRRNDLQREIREVQARKRREVQERKREHFTVGIVGYTNAGKSTLFNTLTAGGAYADNRLFATLMTRTRQWDLAGGLSVMLSDTVGFVRELPHNLIAAFRATLEEATHADVLLIVLDVADQAAELQYSTVNSTLDELLKETAEHEKSQGREWSPPERLVLLNKADKLRSNAEILVWQQKIPGALPICAKHDGPKDADDLPTGIGELTRRVLVAAKGVVQELTLTVPIRDSRTIHLIENRSQVLSRDYTENEAVIRVRIGRRQLDQLRVGGAKIGITPIKGQSTPPPPSAPTAAWSTNS